MITSTTASPGLVTRIRLSMGVRTTDPGFSSSFRPVSSSAGLLSKRPVELVVEEQTEGLLSGRLDLGFIRERLNIDGLLTETVLEDKLVVAVPADHALAGESLLAVGSLTEEPLVAVDRNMLPELYDDTLRMLRKSGGRSDFAQNASSVLAVLGLVAAGLGLAILPASVQAIRLSGVDFVPLKNSPRAAIMLARSEVSLSPHSRYFLEAVRAGVHTPEQDPAR